MGEKQNTPAKILKFERGVFRQNESLRLLRAFVEIANAEERAAVIALAESYARADRGSGLA